MTTSASDGRRRAIEVASNRTPRVFTDADTKASDLFGTNTFDQKAIEAGDDAKLESRLIEAAEKAHRLTQSLRRAGWPAWEFHDRESSIVCVGAFEQLVVPQGNGAAAVNPEIARIVRDLGPDPAKLASGAVMPRSIDGILLDVQPKPIDVPRVPKGWR